jgi:hypothetical protein
MTKLHWDVMKPGDRLKLMDKAMNNYKAWTNVVPTPKPITPKPQPGPTYCKILKWKFFGNTCVLHTEMMGIKMPVLIPNIEVADKIVKNLEHGQVVAIGTKTKYLPNGREVFVLDYIRIPAGR